jgi:hypothetical protein
MQLVLTCLCVLPGWAAPLHAAPAAQYLRLPEPHSSKQFYAVDMNRESGISSAPSSNDRRLNVEG